MTTGTMTDIQNTFLTVLQAGKTAIFGYSLSLLGIWSTFAICWLGIKTALGQRDVIQPFINLVITIGLYTFFVYGFGPGYNGMNLITIAINGFVQAGQAAGGGQVQGNLINDPSAILDLGLTATQPIFDNLQVVTIKIWIPIMAGLTAMLILASYFIMALEVLLTNIEFYMVTSLGLLFLGFGVFRPVAFMAEKFWGAVISFGIKLMVLSCVINIAYPIMQKYTLPASPTWGQMFQILFAAATLAILSHQAPALASAVLAGSPSLTAGAGLRGAIAGGMAAAGIGSAASSAAGVGSTIAKKSSALAGAVSTGGASALKHPFRAMSGSSGSSNVVDAYKGGQQRGTSILEGKNVSSAKSSSTDSGLHGQRESPLKSAFQNMKQAVPPEEKAGPGAGVNLKSSDEEE